MDYALYKEFVDKNRTKFDEFMKDKISLNDEEEVKEEIEITNNNTKLEKVPLASIYRQGQALNIEYTDEARIFEIYGFLSLLTERLAGDLFHGFEDGLSK